MARKKFTRREALKTLGAGGIAVTLMPLWACSRSTIGKASLQTPAPRTSMLAQISPINRSLSTPAPQEFFGDVPVRPHEALWAKEAFLQSRGGLPKTVEETDLVIVGGGMSGLFSAWLMRDKHPIILEQAPRMGGNAKGQSWQGIDYSIGAAYFMEHEEGTPLHNLFSELGLYELCVTKEEEDPVYYNGKIYEDFWKGATDPARKQEFLKLAKHFADMNEDKNGLRYPNITDRSPSMRAYINKLDRENFLQYLIRVNGGPLHPHIATALEHYCWSSLGAGMKDLSAAVALNAYASEFGLVHIAPGGNSRLAERILERLSNNIPFENIRTQSLVIDVRVENDHTLVTYSDSEGALKTIKAKACIMACPKFVAGKILRGIEAKRAEAISKMSYHPYLVANVCLGTHISQHFYDAYLLKDAKVNHFDLPESSRRHQSTDMILGTFASPSQDSTVLTLYRPLPWRAARAELYAPDSYARIRAEFEQEIRTQILQIVGCNESQIQDLRITRWGHPIPIGSPGLIAKKIVDRAHAPFHGKVFFVEQDNWALAAIETCADEAIFWAPQVRAALNA